MQKKLLLATLLTLLMIGIEGCDNNGENENDYPINIPVIDYSIVDIPCHWINLKNEEVIMINSKEEMEKYLACDTETLPEINFDSQTLLLSTGTAPGGVWSVEAILCQNTNNKYSLIIKVDLDFTAIASAPWYCSILVPKMAEESTVELEVEFVRGGLLAMTL